MGTCCMNDNLYRIQSLLKEMHRKDYLSDGRTIWISEWIYIICNKIITILNEYGMARM